MVKDQILLKRQLITYVTPCRSLEDCSVRWTVFLLFHSILIILMLFAVQEMLSSEVFWYPAVRNAAWTALFFTTTSI